MIHPEFVPYVAAALMMLVALYCVSQLLLARRGDPHNHVDVNSSHALMGVGMAGMLVPALNPFSNTVGVVIFSIFTAWFGVTTVYFIVRWGFSGSIEDDAHGLSHPLIHLFMAGAMVYMYAAARGSSAGAGGQSSGMAMSGATAQGPALVTLFFVLALIAAAVLQLDDLARLSAPQRSLATVSGAAGSYRDDGSRDQAPLTSNRLSVVGVLRSETFRPRFELVYQAVMCVTMGYMLLLMV
jgi:hypothetical protein